jgi:hypothetical protein
VAHGRVLGVLDTVKAQGLTRVAFGAALPNGFGIRWPAPMSTLPELRRGGIAALVFAGDRASNASTEWSARTLPSESPAAIVLDNAAASTLRGFAFAVGAAVALHAGVGFFAFRGSPLWLPKGAAKSVRPVLRIDHVVDFAPQQMLSAPDSSPPPKVEPTAASIPRARKPVAGAPAPSLPSPSQAGQVVPAQESAADELDFTAFDLATGPARRYEGGESSSLGGNIAQFRARVSSRAPLRGESNGLAERVGSACPLRIGAAPGRVRLTASRLWLCGGRARLRARPTLSASDRR